MPEWMQARLAGTAENPGEVEVAPDEADAVALFVAMGTQWHRHGMTGERLGLMYDAVEPTARLASIPIGPAMFGDLQIMEAAALAALAERAKR